MTFNPNASNLDQEQIIQQVFNPDDNSLRVDATVTATISNIELKDPNNGNTLNINNDGSINADIIVSALSDNIASWTNDGVGNPIGSTDGALNVNIVDNISGTTISLYNEITNTAMNSISNILTYTVPSSQSLQLNKIIVSSDSISTIELDFNGAPNAKGRLCYTDYNLTLGYNNLLLTSGTVIVIKGTNNSLQGVASFNATLQGTLI
jgi:hypothetical protein